jgi:hypothetical protein
MMLAEANYFSKKLNLPMRHPLLISDAAIHPSPPLFSRIDNTNFTSLADRIRNAKFVVSGNLETTTFSFYYHEGHLWDLGWSVDGQMKYDEHAPSLIDTNGAYQLARQWLAAVDVDVAALEEKYKPSVEQRWYIRPGVGTGDTNIVGVPVTAPGQADYASIAEKDKIFVPTFEVTWGGDAARVKVLGTRKELMELHLGDWSFSRRPQLVITNAIELSNTPAPPVIHRLQHVSPMAQTNAAPNQSVFPK